MLLYQIGIFCKMQYTFMHMVQAYIMAYAQTYRRAKTFASATMSLIFAYSSG